MLKVNLQAPFHLAWSLLGGMLRRGAGVIINVSSDVAIHGYPGWGAYAVSKAAIDGLTRTWASELEGTGVSIYSIDPGDMNTDMHRAALPDDDPAELADPADVAEAFLAVAAGEVPPATDRLEASTILRGRKGGRCLSQLPTPRPPCEPPPPEPRLAPAEMRGLRRDHVRLLVADRAGRTISHSRFDHIGDFLRPDDLLVVNTSRTLPAAVPAVREDGSTVQLRPCVRRPGSWDVLSVEPRPPFSNVQLSPGERLRIGDSMTAVVTGRRPDIPLLWRLEVDGDGLGEIVATGDPIRYSYVPRPIPLDFYQTVYADRPGSAEMPSAGRPFSRELLLHLAAGGIETAAIVLHTGLSSYQDDDFDLEHRLFEEWFEIDEAAAAAVNAARRVVAVGTTVVRALETAAAGAGGDARVRPMRGWTELRITPGTALHAVDGLITGLHEPQASHFDLLQAFLDDELLGRAYGEAVERRYLWHEFGDSMLIV